MGLALAGAPQNTGSAAPAPQPHTHLAQQLELLHLCQERQGGLAACRLWGRSSLLHRDFLHRLGVRCHHVHGASAAERGGLRVRAKLTALNFAAHPPCALLVATRPHWMAHAATGQQASSAVWGRSRQAKGACKRGVWLVRSALRLSSQPPHHLCGVCGGGCAAVVEEDNESTDAPLTCRATRVARAKRQTVRQLVAR